MGKTIYIYACGGYSDITTRVYDTLEEAQEAMKIDYEGMMEGREDDELCFISSMHAEINLDGMAAEDVWGASISAHEIETPDKCLFVHKDPRYGDDAAEILPKQEAYDRLHEEVLSALEDWIEIPSGTTYHDVVDAYAAIRGEQDISGNDLAENITNMFELCESDADAIYFGVDSAVLPTGKYEGVFYEWSIEDVA